MSSHYVPIRRRADEILVSLDDDERLLLSQYLDEAIDLLNGWTDDPSNEACQLVSKAYKCFRKPAKPPKRPTTDGASESTGLGRFLARHHR